MKITSQQRSDDVQVLRAGLLSTVQAAGRAHVGSFGVAPAGYADWFSARTANKLVGNEPGAALIETTLNGIAFAVTRSTEIAVTGAQAELSLNQRPVQRWRTIRLRAGDQVEVGMAQRGVRSYIAFAGGLRVKAVLGSASTDVTAGFGGLLGRALHEGDGLQLSDAPAAIAARSVAPRALAARALAPRTLALPDPPRWGCNVALRVTPGPHLAWIVPAARVARAVHAVTRANQKLAALTSALTSFTVTARCNRQGVRLQGPILTAPEGWDALSFGTSTGCVQVTNDGQAIILLCERQTTGGYGVPWVVICADHPLAAQLRPGDAVSFEAVTQAEAAKARSQRIREAEAVVER